MDVRNEQYHCNQKIAPLVISLAQNMKGINSKLSNVYIVVMIRRVLLWLIEKINIYILS